MGQWRSWSSGQAVRLAMRLGLATGWRMGYIGIQLAEGAEEGAEPTDYTTNPGLRSPP
ncbi:MAG TPA: hypothetical protein VFU60_17310 [Ktedonobacterales bacterium]|nr:hypothetical protein [Ktedonobacterales bacterium]